MFLVPLGILGLMTAYVGVAKGWWSSMITGSTKPSTYSERLAHSRQTDKLYDLTGKKTLAEKFKKAASPFSGTTKNMAPRVPPPYVAPIPKLSHRIDWRSSTGHLFQKPEFKQSYKRVHQMVYGTPTTFARRGQLTSDWGHAHMKGYPIHQGRTQNWLPGLFPEIPQVELAEEMPQSHESQPVSHFNLGWHLSARRQKHDRDEVPASNHKIVW